ncbi:MAG: GIY-YIG nuclease family protein [Chloroflexi bacterium]|jgi:putative endonuclease|nr:GIY-YIG nuclease family protein [Chloroflexota bacterium]
MSTLDNKVLYTGVTNNLIRRINEHRQGKGSAFVKKYKVYKLVYFECGGDIMTAINREKQIKAGSRTAKEKLILSMNVDWKDLAEDLF